MMKHLMLIHGRSFKPAEARLKKLWFNAIKFGLQRDGYDNALNKKIKKTFVYYGNISNDFLSASGNFNDQDKGSYDQEEDLLDRNECLENLKKYKRDDFLGDKGKNNYEKLESFAPAKEWLADTFGGFLESFGIAEHLIRTFAKDIEHYWSPDSAFGSDVRWKLTEPLESALIKGDDVFLVSHSLGTMIAYDVLWKFSHTGEYKELRKNGSKLTTLVTLGSPLGNETVKRNLKGARAVGNCKFPTLIQHWENLAAEDDYISHDETLGDDYKKMKRAGLVNSIRDHRPYNLAVRNGKPNPHHGVGYLIHPEFIKLLGEWLVN